MGTLLSVEPGAEGAGRLAGRRGVAGWARRALLWLLCGGVVGQWALMIVDVAWPGALPRAHAVLLCTVYAPLAVALAGLWRDRGRVSARGPDDAPDGRWLGATLLVFGGWAGVYFGAAALTAGRTVAAPATPIDAAVPLAPAAVWVYLTVYWFHLLPFQVLRERALLRRALRAEAAAMAVCAAGFVLWPVATGRPAVPATDLSSWALSVLYRADPPHNCFPSAHCAEAMFAALLLGTRGRAAGGAALGYALLIGLTTLLTRQHFAIDVAAGFALAAIAWTAAAPAARAWALPARGAPAG